MLRLVDQVVCPCPLVLTEDFMAEHGIDLVVHGFASDEDAKRQHEFFEIPMRMGRFQRISYYTELSTTDIIRKIQSLPHEEDEEATPETKWFGTALASATSNSPVIPFDPFPLELRIVLEPHIRKATKRRTEALCAIRRASNNLSESAFSDLINSPLSVEGDFEFDPARHSLRSALLQAANLSDDTNLALLHTRDDNNNNRTTAKDSLQHALTCNFRAFQQVFDEFVRSVCAPRLASLCDCGDTIYYQAFPCLRIVQPGEF